MARIFVTTPGAIWCAIAFTAGCLSLHPRHARFRAWFAGLCVSLLSLAVLGERAALVLTFFVAALCAAALEIASGLVRERGAAGAAIALELLAIASVPAWHHTRDRTPLRYVDPETLAVYARIPERGGLARTFDVTLATDSVDGVYGRSSFSPYWTGRPVPFGAFPQGAPIASNLQLALVGKLVSELAADPPELSSDALDLLALLHVEWLVDRDEAPRLARLALDPTSAELREPGLLRVRHASPALFASRLERVPDASRRASGAEAGSLMSQLEAHWSSDPLEKRGQRSLDALSRTGTRRDWDVVLPLLQAMAIDRARAVADCFFTERALTQRSPSENDAIAFGVLAHEQRLASVEVVARASAPGFVRLAYAFDPELALAVDGEPAQGVPDFLGAVVLPFPAGTHAITLRAPAATLRLALLQASAAGALALALVWLWALVAGARPR